MWDKTWLEEWAWIDVPEMDFSKIKKKAFEELCREDYGIELWEKYIFEVLEDIDFKHWTAWEEDEKEAKFRFKLKKGTRLIWMPESNRKVIKLRFEWDNLDHTDIIHNQWDFPFDRVIQTEDGESEYRVKSRNKDFGKSTLKKKGTIYLPAAFFWAMFHMEGWSKNIKIYDASWSVRVHIKDQVKDTIEWE